MQQAQWYAHEMRGARLPDQRFRHSLPRLVGRLARHPRWSWSRALDHDGRQSARRLVRRMDGDDRSLLAGHCQCTAERCQAFPRVLCVQDTTYLNLDRHRATDLGPSDPDPESNGLLAHSALAVSPSGVPLGRLDLRLGQGAVLCAGAQRGGGVTALVADPPAAGAARRAQEQPTPHA